MNAGIDLVLERLRGASCPPRPSGDGWSARCPVPGHDDRNPSLSISAGRDHPVVVRCHGGCDADQVLGSLGLTLAEVCAPSPNGHRSSAPSRAEIARYSYRDADGTHLYSTVRLSPKAFRLDPKGFPKDRWVPYRLPEVREAIAESDRVIIAEGEKDCDNLMAAGAAAATTNPFGAGKWLDRYDRHFQGADVWIVADRDKPGAEHALDVAEHLRPVAEHVTLMIPKVGKDASDHLAAGSGLTDFVIVSDDELRALAVARPCDLCGQMRGGGPVCVHCLDGAVTVTLSTVMPERVEWLWPQWLPLGKLVTLDGDPGLAKSTLTLTFAARLSTGSPMPDGSPLIGKHDVIVMSAEDGLADTIRPRLDAAGADPARVHAFTEVRYLDAEGRERTRPPSFPADLDRLAAMISAHGARLAIVDVLMAYLSGDVDSHKDQDVRGVLHRLSLIAERHRCTILALRHFTKVGNAKAVHRGGGSVGIIGAARLGLVVGEDPDDETDQRRVLAVAKSNLAAIPKAMAYRIVGDEQYDCAKIEWLGSCDHRANDLVRSEPTAGADPDAKDALIQVLADGPLWAKEAFDGMGAAGFSKDQTKAAKSKLHVQSVKVGKPGDADSGWQWHLPGGTEGSENGAKGAKGAMHETPTPSTPSGSLRLVLQDHLTTEGDHDEPA